MILLFALGIANIFTFRVVIIIFCALALFVHQALANPLSLSPFFSGTTALTVSTHSSASAFVILFIEVPLLLRICPTSATFDAAIRKVSTNYMRAAAYVIMSAVQFISLVSQPATSLIAGAVVLLITAIFYGLAGIKGQAFVGSKTLGGQGVAQMIV